MLYKSLIFNLAIFTLTVFGSSGCAPISGTFPQSTSSIWMAKNQYLMFHNMDSNKNNMSIVSPFPRTGCKNISANILSKINWLQVPQITTVIRAGDFVPMVMRIKQGRPYVLRIRNRDEKIRYFRAMDFFRRNATISITVDGGKANKTCVHAVHIPARKSAEIRFVAIEDGHYEFEDTFSIIPMVMSAGPSGVIIIEERKNAILQE